MTSFITLIEEILGEYVPLNGDGIASLNLEWIVCAILWIMVIWFIFKLILRLIEGSNRRTR